MTLKPRMVERLVKLARTPAFEVFTVISSLANLGYLVLLTVGIDERALLAYLIVCWLSGSVCYTVLLQTLHISLLQVTAANLQVWFKVLNALRWGVAFWASSDSGAGYGAQDRSCSASVRPLYARCELHASTENDSHVRSLKLYLTFQVMGNTWLYGQADALQCRRWLRLYVCGWYIVCLGLLMAWSFGGVKHNPKSAMVLGVEVHASEHQRNALYVILFFFGADFMHEVNSYCKSRSSQVCRMVTRAVRVEWQDGDAAGAPSGAYGIRSGGRGSASEPRPLFFAAT